MIVVKCTEGGWRVKMRAVDEDMESGKKKERERRM